MGQPHLLSFIIFQTTSQCWAQMSHLSTHSIIPLPRSLPLVVSQEVVNFVKQARAEVDEGLLRRNNATQGQHTTAGSFNSQDSQVFGVTVGPGSRDRVGSTLSEQGSSQQLQTPKGASADAPLGVQL